MPGVLQRYGAKIFLAIALVGCHWGMWVFTRKEMTLDAIEHGSPPPTFDQVWVGFWSRWFENFTSEYGQLLTAALIATYAIQRRIDKSDSTADKDDVKDLRKRIEEIAEKVGAERSDDA